MAKQQVNPTRMELTKQKKKLRTATRGHKLLKDKLDELMRQFMDLVRETKRLRKTVERQLGEAGASFSLAAATMSKERLGAALMVPKQSVELEAGMKNVMSVEVPVFDYRFKAKQGADSFSYGFASTSGELDAAVSELADVLPALLQLAGNEKATMLMAAEIEKTRRRVNALEHVMIPEMRTNIKYITMKLDENERSTQVRLMKVKDMMLEQAHHYKDRR
ncbi:MAG: V-type ATP synthase subunit D [Lachnospiraceae bacterium]|nr:V-type ATP synthase subunit D [Lachnospiraceae bacterium]MDY5742181.1 V-type ATP synthase subunit D [Lachnospiraceae bacterium]